MSTTTDTSSTGPKDNAGFDHAEFLRRQAALLNAYTPPISTVEEFEMMNSFFAPKGRRFVFFKRRRWVCRIGESLGRRIAEVRRRIQDKRN